MTALVDLIIAPGGALTAAIAKYPEFGLRLSASKVIALPMPDLTWACQLLAIRSPQKDLYAIVKDEADHLCEVLTAVRQNSNTIWHQIQVMQFSVIAPDTFRHPAEFTLVLVAEGKELRLLVQYDWPNGVRNIVRLEADMYRRMMSAGSSASASAAQAQMQRAAQMPTTPPITAQQSAVAAQLQQAIAKIDLKLAQEKLKLKIDKQYQNMAKDMNKMLYDSKDWTGR